jgi:hypothetical protein
MGIESYNFLMFNSENKCVLTDLGWDIIGNKYLSFQQIKDEILKIEQIKLDKLGNELNECYFVYKDEESIIEFEINNGEVTEQVQEISTRFALCNPFTNYDTTLTLLELLAQKLDLSVLDMRLGEIIQFDNELSIKRSRNSYLNKRKEFFGYINLSEVEFNKPLRSGSEVFNYITKIKG